MEISGHFAVIKLRCSFAEGPRAVSVSHRGKANNPLVKVYFCVLGCLKVRVLCVCTAFVLVSNLCVFTFMHVYLNFCISKWVHIHTVCWQSVCVCVSFWWYFPRALCYAGQLLHPSYFDSSAAPPGGAPTTRSTDGVCVCVCVCVHEYAYVTAMTVTLCEPWHTHKPHKHKYGHAPLTLTSVECQHPYNANEKLLFSFSYHHLVFKTCSQAYTTHLG